eukprot:CAMPEP_0172319924 /NCGR_PEP_ID=MMETSP1058-20130122/39056_1 /TAXON_ID=83371 /ORGANISM="Detonula confervacea, Strain CCMP 353" /LENGTH=66 /DNA_ID=CAMNT_0013035069 /DNA_START=69 /DNA_END=265 /DNA_ORIENTATION=+
MRAVVRDQFSESNGDSLGNDECGAGGWKDYRAVSSDIHAGKAGLASGAFLVLATVACYAAFLGISP